MSRRAVASPVLGMTAISLLAALSGAAAAAQRAHAELRISAFLAVDSGSERLVRTRFDVPPGLFIYSHPLPDGYQATTVHVQEIKGVQVGEAVYPATHERSFAALGVTLNVYDSVVEVSSPLYADLDMLRHEGFDEDDLVTLPIIIRYQLCSDQVCYLPRSVEVALSSTVGALAPPS